MPITAKLSQAFYDRLGHPIADEMVDWFNQMDAASRSDLHQLNELNFARFDAKLEQRVSELSGKIDRVERALDQLDARLTARIDQVYAELSTRIDLLEAKLTARIDRSIADLALRLEHQQIIQMRWTVGMWLTTMIAIAGLWIRR